MKALFCFISIIGISLSAFSTPPRLGYEARLTDAAGRPLKGEHLLVFSLFHGGSADQPDSGLLIYSEAATVKAENGYVSHGIGTGEVTFGGALSTAIFDTSEDVYLQVSVDGTDRVILPRKSLDSAAYAFIAADAQALGGRPASDYALKRESFDAPEISHSISGTGAHSTIAGGLGNNASGTYSTVGGGVSNSSTGDYATIGGGGENRALAASSTVAGGYGNIATGLNSSAIGGGAFNYASGDFAGVASGLGNRALGISAFVGGGWDNEASGANGATVSGGLQNRATKSGATVAGGSTNEASGEFSSIAGGLDNVASSTYALVGGGESNAATASHSHVVGGRDNEALGRYSAVAGGFNNSASNAYSASFAGAHNVSRGLASFVGGGYFNLADLDFSCISGGTGNLANGYGSMVGGGVANTATGYYATVPGGQENSATNYSFAAGRSAKANQQGCFVWADSGGNALYPGGPDRFIARASGGVKFFSNGTATTGVQLSAGGGAWSSVSDRNMKENVQTVEPREVLQKLAKIPVQTWNYKTQDAWIRHIGPMAQDFKAAFGLGEDDKTISTIDADGVALAAIQGLYEEGIEKDQRIKNQASKIEHLEAKIEKLEKAVIQISQMSGAE